MEKSKVLNLLWDYFLMTVGSVIFCMAWTSFIIPTGLASGGLTGLCTIIEYATNGAIPMGIPYWIMNIGLLIIILRTNFNVESKLLGSVNMIRNERSD